MPDDEAVPERTMSPELRRFLWKVATAAAIVVVCGALERYSSSPDAWDLLRRRVKAAAAPRKRRDPEPPSVVAEAERVVNDALRRGVKRG